MFFVIGRPKSLEDLKGIIEQNVGELRKNTSIAVIDDEPFISGNNLRDRDFNIKEIGDIKAIQSIASYPVVLCDIKGVGAAFKSEYEGGYIISEIVKYFPHKVVIAYTGERFDPTYNKFFQLCDFTMKKDSTLDEWADALDQAIKIAVNPINQWIKTRNRLLSMGISSINLIKIENAFVNSVITNENKFHNQKVLNILQADMKQIMLNLIANVITKGIGI
ncbi:hypothetical protein EHQ24_01595 [Leptospira noumeaensis]|uniref:Uncharacterized protein n=1 Tax=Leptospira noumeaensis TaxID=2484964 RepID=A0A4R9IHQ5_9LEPT|nr:hypothetical protein [Leptospira noumeaensis]TGK87929.1 hypothetical protein EHQ24_01595 [Leptospira noumeaensis]